MNPAASPVANEAAPFMVRSPSRYTTGAMPIEARIRVRLTPRAAHDEIAGWRGDLLRVRVTAPPVGGRANAALERLLADALGVPKSAVRVVSGARAREKTVAIEGARQEELLSRLPAKPPARLL